MWCIRLRTNAAADVGDFNCTTTFTFCDHVICKYTGAIDLNYFTILGGSLKKIEKNMIPNVPTNKKV